MAELSSITVRVELRPALTMWDALILRIAGRQIRNAFASTLYAVAENVRVERTRTVFGEQRSNDEVKP